MKRSAIFLLLIVLIVALSSRSVPDTRPLTVQINGSVVNAPAAMDIAEGQVMVPLRWAAANESHGKIAIPTNTVVLVDDKPISFEVYAIEDSNYFKLRDLAKALSGTRKQFDVTWDGKNNEIIILSGEEYSETGGELSISKDRGSSTASITTSKVYLNNHSHQIDFIVYNIDGYNYFKLSDLADAMNFFMAYGTTNTIEIDTFAGYSVTGNKIYYSDDTCLSDEPVTGVKSSIIADLDGDGKTETAALVVSQDNEKKWTLYYKHDESEASVSIFKGNENGFVTSIAAGHIISDNSIDFLVSVNLMSMPFGGYAYELYSLKDGTFTKIDISGITDGTEFDVSVDENNKTAKLTSNGSEKVVDLSDLALSDYKIYGKEFCQDFFVEMKLQSVEGYAWPDLVTTEVIAAVLPNDLTYLHTTYRFVDGVCKVQKVEFYDFDEAMSGVKDNTKPTDNIALMDAGNSWSIDEDGNVIISYSNGKTTVKAPVTLNQNEMDFAGEANPGIFISKEKTAIAYGGAHGEPVYVIDSNDMGKTWTRSDMVSDGVGVNQQYIGFITPSDGWLVLCNFHGMGSEDHFIYQTSDGGKTWTQIGNPNDVYARVLTGAGFANDEIGFLCFRYDDSDFQPAICWTRDGGQTWKKLYVILPKEFDQYSKTPLSPVFNGANGLFPIQLSDNEGAAGTIYLTSGNYGKTWIYDEKYNLART